MEDYVTRRSMTVLLTLKEKAEYMTADEAANMCKRSRCCTLLQVHGLCRRPEFARAERMSCVSWREQVRALIAWEAEGSLFKSRRRTGWKQKYSEHREKRPYEVGGWIDGALRIPFFSAENVE